MNGFLKNRRVETDHEVFVTMLDRAVVLAKLGKNVLIEDVPHLFEYDADTFYHCRTSAEDLMLVDKNKNLWKYKDVTITSKIKYVPIQRLMLNVLFRNKNPDDHRNPVDVLDQYPRFFVSTQPSKEGIDTVKIEKDDALDTIKTDDLKSWIERALQLNFFSLYGAESVNKNGENIDEALVVKSLKERTEIFEKELSSLEGSAEPEKQAMGKMKSESWKELTAKIAEKTHEIFKRMNIPLDAKEAILHAYSDTGFKPSILRDPTDTRQETKR